MARTRVSLLFNGAKLRTLRELRGLRQQDLSNLAAEQGCRIPQSTISMYENGEAYPQAHNFGALVRVLGCDPHELLDNDLSAAS